MESKLFKGNKIHKFEVFGAWEGKGDPCVRVKSLTDYEWQYPPFSFQVVEKGAVDRLADALEHLINYVEAGAGCESDAEIDMKAAENAFKVLKEYRGEK